MKFRSIVIWMMWLCSVVSLAFLLVSFSLVIKNLKASSSSWPEGLKNCKTYQVNQNGKGLTIVRCPNSSVQVKN